MTELLVSGEVGIKNVANKEVHPEINSPLKRRKTLGGLKIELKPESDEEHSPLKKDPEYNFTELDQIWSEIQANLLDSRGFFELLKNKS